MSKYLMNSKPSTYLSFLLYFHFGSFIFSLGFHFGSFGEKGSQFPIMSLSRNFQTSPLQNVWTMTQWHDITTANNNSWHQLSTYYVPGKNVFNPHNSPRSLFGGIIILILQMRSIQRQKREIHFPRSYDFYKLQSHYLNPENLFLQL